MKKSLALLVIIALILPAVAHRALAEMKVAYSRKGSIIRHIPLPEVPDCRVLKNRLSRDEGRMYIESMEMDAVTAESMAPMAKGLVSNTLGSDDGRAGGSEDFSETNIQVEGVDEADIVKTDGEFIYIVKGKGVRIIKAHPANQLEEVATIRDDESGFHATEMYVDGDYLVIIGNMFESSKYRRPMPYYWRGNITKAYIFNISNINNIKEERSVEFEGSYYTSRRIGDQLYLVLNQHAYNYPSVRDTGNVEITEEGIMPHMTDSATGESEPIAMCGDVAFFPGYRQPHFLIIASIPLGQNSASIKRKVVLGSTDNVYVSQDNLFVTMRTYPWIDHFSSIWPPISRRAVFESSLIYKFNLDDGKIKYDGAGEVPGTVLNQFSMDEHKGNFRIATTRGNLWGEGESLARNNLYVLDEDMERIGEIEDIAPGEKIYPVRFMGDRAYMVTFKSIDPLFVIGLKDPKNPKILGKLKIPGYSDYLHPYDENHIIGFGKDAVTSEKDENFAWYQGMKIALFDVSDVANPKQKFMEIIGDRGTDSELLRNHKALLFSKEKDIIAFPITVAKINEEYKNEKYGESASQYGEQVFQGLYVYNLDLQSGFNLKGKITHISEEDQLKSGYQIGDYRDHIKRGLYIDNFLYTISENQVHAHGLTSLDKIEAIELEAEPEENYYYPYYKDGIEPAIME